MNKNEIPLTFTPYVPPYHYAEIREKDKWQPNTHFLDPEESQTVVSSYPITQERKNIPDKQSSTISV